LIVDAEQKSPFTGAVHVEVKRESPHQSNVADSLDQSLWIFTTHKFKEQVVQGGTTHSLMYITGACRVRYIHVVRMCCLGVGEGFLGIKLQYYGYNVLPIGSAQLRVIFSLGKEESEIPRPRTARE
jgi:hypothetical protein